MATLWVRLQEARRAVLSSAIPAGTPWPDTFGEEATFSAARLAVACAPTATRPDQPTADDLADPDQEWVEITTLGEAQPRYVRGRR